MQEKYKKMVGAFLAQWSIVFLEQNKSFTSTTKVMRNMRKYML